MSHRDEGMSRYNPSRHEQMMSSGREHMIPGSRGQISYNEPSSVSYRAVPSHLISHHPPLYVHSSYSSIGIMAAPARTTYAWPVPSAPVPKVSSSSSKTYRTDAPTAPVIRTAQKDPTGSKAASVKKPSKPTSSPQVDLTQPALPAVALPVDREYEEMAAGLRLQKQEWLEKVELKKVISDTTRLVDNLQTILSAGVDQSSATALRNLVDNVIPNHLDSLQMRVTSQIRSLIAISNDIEAHSKELSVRDQSLSELREGRMVAALSELHRAKRSRRFHVEFERLASECLAKKPRHSYSADLEAEQEKLVEVQNVTSLWKDVGEFRNRQVDMALLHVKDLLDSLRSPETVVDLIRRAKEMTDELPT